MNIDLKRTAEVLQFACFNKYSSVISGILCEHLESRDEFDSLPRDCQDWVLVHLIEWIVKGRRFSLFRECLTIFKLLRIAHPNLCSRRDWGKLELGIKLKIVLEQMLNGSSSGQCLETFQQLFPTFDEKRQVHGSSNERRLPYLLHQLIMHPSQREEASSDVTFQREVGSNLVGTISHRVKHLRRNLDRKLPPSMLQKLRDCGSDALQEDWRQLSEENQELYRMAVDGRITSGYLMERLHLDTIQNDENLAKVIPRLFGPGAKMDEMRDDHGGCGASGVRCQDSDQIDGLPTSSFYSRGRIGCKRSSPLATSTGWTEVRACPEISEQRTLESHQGMSDHKKLGSNTGKMGRRKLETQPRLSGQEGITSQSELGKLRSHPGETGQRKPKSSSGLSEEGKLKSKLGISECRNLRSHPGKSERPRPKSHPGVSERRNFLLRLEETDLKRPESHPGMSERRNLRERHQGKTGQGRPLSHPGISEEGKLESHHGTSERRKLRSRHLTSSGSTKSGNMVSLDTEEVLKLACRCSKPLVELRKLPLSLAEGTRQVSGSLSFGQRSSDLTDVQGHGSKASSGGKNSMKELFSSESQDCFLEANASKRKRRDSCTGLERAKRVKVGRDSESMIAAGSNGCKENVLHNVSRGGEEGTLSSTESEDMWKKKAVSSTGGVDSALGRKVCGGIENVDLHSSADTASMSPSKQDSPSSKKSREKLFVTGSFYSHTRPSLRNYRWRSPSRKVEISPPGVRALSPHSLTSPSKDSHSSKEGSDELLVVGSFYARSLASSKNHRWKSPDRTGESGSYPGGKRPSPGMTSPGKDTHTHSSKESSEELMVVGSFYSRSLPRLRNYSWKSPIERRQGSSLHGTNSLPASVCDGQEHIKTNRMQLRKAEKMMDVNRHGPHRKSGSNKVRQSHLGENCMDNNRKEKSGDKSDICGSSQVPGPQLAVSPVFEYRGSFSGSSNEGSVSLLTGRRVLFGANDEAVVDVNAPVSRDTLVPSSPLSLQVANGPSINSSMQRRYKLLFETDGSESEVPVSSSIQAIPETPPEQVLNGAGPDASPPSRPQGGSGSGSLGSMGKSGSNSSDYQNAQKPETETPSLSKRTPEDECVPTSDEEEDTGIQSWKKSRFPSLRQHLRLDRAAASLRQCTVPLERIKLEEMRMRILLSSESSNNEDT